MKRGDLVKLVLPAMVGSFQRAGPVHRFPEGTVAVFLAPDPDDASLASILVEGRVGWVWSRYLEAV